MSVRLVVGVARASACIVFACGSLGCTFTSSESEVTPPSSTMVQPVTPAAPSVDPPQPLPLPVATAERGDRLPQLDERETSHAFDHARPIEGAVRAGLLVCRVQVRHETDEPVLEGGSDVALILRLGSDAPRMTPQRSARTYTFPIASLEAGASFELEVVDDDFATRDTIASFAGRYERTPFVLESDGARVECRALASVEPGAARTRAVLHAALDAYVAAPPSLLAQDLGRPTALVDDALSAVAAWVGWDDSSIAVALARAREADAAFVGALVAEVSAESARLPERGSPVESGDVRVRVADVLCDDDARAARRAMGSALFAGASPRCDVVIEITALAATSLGWISAREEEAWALHADGSRERARRLPTSCDGRWHDGASEIVLTPGMRCEAHLGLHDAVGILRVGPPLLARPVLLRLERRGHPSE